MVWLRRIRFPLGAQRRHRVEVHPHRDDHQHLRDVGLRCRPVAGHRCEAGAAYPAPKKRGCCLGEPSGEEYPYLAPKKTDYFLGVALHRRPVRQVAGTRCWQVGLKGQDLREQDLK
jgi:hypothetical protein